MTLGDWTNSSVCVTNRKDVHGAACGIGKINQTRTCTDGVDQKCRELSGELKERQKECTMQSCPPGNQIFANFFVVKNKLILFNQI